MRYLSVLTVFFVLASERAYAAADFLEDVRAGEVVTIATMGTSLTANSSAYWTSPLRTWLQSESPIPANVSLLNFGVGASSSDNSNFNLSGIDRQLPRVIAQNPDVVFIEFAINDAFVPYRISQAQSVNNLNFMVDQLRSNDPHVQIVVQTMNNAIGGAQTSRPMLENYYQGYRDVTADRDLLLIDHYPVWLDLRNTDPATWNRYVPDTIHPNALGANAIILPGIQASLEAVPEPSSLALLGLAGFFGIQRVRRVGKA